MNKYLEFAQGVLGIIGLLAPVFVATYLFLKSPELLTDLKKRLFNLKGFSHIYTFIAIFFIFGSIVLAQLLCES